MKKLHFNVIFMIVLCACSVPTFVLVNYLERTGVFEGVGIGNTVLLSVVVSMLPSLLISIWWWNFQDKDSYPDEE